MVLSEFSEYARVYGIQHLTSSPHFPQSNGQVERMVQTMKGMLKQSTDPNLAVLSYRATPMPWCGLSPAELCMGRRIRTTVPQTLKQLTPSWSYLPQFRSDNSHCKKKQKDNFDKRHRAQEQSDISDGSEVVVTTERQPVEGKVLHHDNNPRSYIVATPSGNIRRNRTQLNVIPERAETLGDSNPATDSDSSTAEAEAEAPVQAKRVPTRIPTRSTTGINLVPPDYLLEGRCGDIQLLTLCILLWFYCNLTCIALFISYCLSCLTVNVC